MNSMKPDNTKEIKTMVVIAFILISILTIIEIGLRFL